MKHPQRSHWLLTAVLLMSLPALAIEPTTADPGLIVQLNSIWQQEQPSTTVLARSFEKDENSDPTHYETSVRDALTYTELGPDSAQITYRRKDFPANTSDWGALPSLDITHAQLLSMRILNRHYQVLSATGDGLFTVGDWQRFGFLHVVDVTSRRRPVHYALIAEAGLRDRVLGRLPGSEVLNYMRLVPSRHDKQQNVLAYEVLMYALDRKGLERVLDENEHPLAYKVQRKNSAAPWVLTPANASPVAAARDANNRPFTAPMLAAASPAAGATAKGAPQPPAPAATANAAVAASPANNGSNTSKPDSPKSGAGHTTSPSQGQ